MREFTTGATRDSDEGKLHYAGYLSPVVLQHFARYMKRHELQADGQRRVAGNWKKGMPQGKYAESLVRHTMDFWQAVEGDGYARIWEQTEDGEWDCSILSAEELACAIMFNVQGWLYEQLTRRYEKAQRASGEATGASAFVPWPTGGDGSRVINLVPPGELRSVGLTECSSPSEESGDGSPPPKKP